MRYDSDLPKLRGPRAGAEQQQSNSSAWELREIRGIVRRRWWIVALAGLVALGAAWWTESGKAPVYTAQVLMEQRSQAPIIGLGGGGGGDFASQIEVIRGRAVVSRVVQDLGLQLQLHDRGFLRSRVFCEVEVEADPGGGQYRLTRSDGKAVVVTAPDGGYVASAAEGEWLEGPGFRFSVCDLTALGDVPLPFGVQDLQRVTMLMQGRVRVEPGRAPMLVRIQFTDQDPVLAAAVVNTMAAAYQDQRAVMAREQARVRREVIARELVALADSLTEAQDQVVAYQRESGRLDPGIEGSRATSALLETENEIRTLRFEEGLLSSVVAGLQGEDAGDASLNRILSLGGNLIPAGPTLMQRLQDLQIERSRLTASRFGRTAGDPEVEVIDSLMTSTREQIRAAAEQGLEFLRIRLGAAEDRMAEMQGEIRSMPGQSAEMERLRQRADAVQTVVDQLVSRYYEAQIAEATEAGDVVVVDPAPVPLWPNPSQARLTMLLGLLAGLIIGGGAALLIEYFNPRVRGADDAEEVTGLPLLGVIPRIGASSRNRVAAAVGKEAFRSLRTNLRFAREREPRLLAVTSAVPRQGKTTVAVNLATTLAEQGAQSVLLLDGDLRRPLTHKTFGLKRSPGLTDLLIGTASEEECLQQSSVHPGLFLLAAGEPVANPSAVTDSEAFSDLLSRLSARFDFVVIDTPPVLAVTDGAVISKLVDGTLIVVRADEADPVAAARAVEQLRQIDASLLGVILNGVGASGSEGHYYHEYYGEYLEVESAGDLKTPPNGRVRRLLGAGSGRE